MSQPSKNGALSTQTRTVSSAMSEKPDKLTFAAIGDLHVKEDRTSSFRELFAELSTKAQVLVLCGDLTDLGKPSEAELLAEDLRACSVPVARRLRHAVLPALKACISARSSDAMYALSGSRTGEGAIRHGSLRWMSAPARA